MGLPTTLPSEQSSMILAIRSLLLRAGKPAGVGKEIQEAAGRHVGIQRPVLGQIAQPGGTGQPVGRHVVAGDPSHALRGGQVAGQQFHRRALAGSVGAQKGHHLALVNLERDVQNGRELAIRTSKAPRLRSWRTPCCWVIVYRSCCTAIWTGEAIPAPYEPRPPNLRRVPNKPILGQANLGR